MGFNSFFDKKTKKKIKKALTGGRMFGIIYER